MIFIFQFFCFILDFQSTLILYEENIDKALFGL
jgi:hypothetical protein